MTKIKSWGDEVRHRRRIKKYGIDGEKERSATRAQKQKDDMERPFIWTMGWKADLKK